MKKLFILLMLLPFLASGQIQKGSILSSFRLEIDVSPLIKFSKYPENNTTDFKISITSRTGKFLKDSTLMVGVNLNVAYRKTTVYQVSNSSSPTGGNYFDEGGGEKVYGHVGLFVDRYFKIRKNLYLSLNNDLVFAVGGFYETIYTVDSDGNKVNEYPYHTMRAAPGIAYSFWPNLTYFITPKHALTCSAGQINLDLYGVNVPEPWEGYYPHLQFNIDFPAVDFGYTYRF